MSLTARNEVLASIDRLFGTGTSAGWDDAALLERFLEHGDETAFERLLERHGPLVLHVCRRYLQDPGLVDDAFQATFLILIRRAPSIRERRLLGNWLYGVATRVARRARSRQWSLAKHTDGFDSLEPACAEGSGDDKAGALDEHRVLHEELARLPAKYREPVVLCYLEGHTHEQAAEALRWPVGTVRGRLHRARELLRRRLERRGLSQPVPILATELARPLLRIPAELAQASLAVARVAVLDPVSRLAAGTVSAGALSLAQGVLGPMAWIPWKSVAVASAGFAVSGLAIAYQAAPVARSSAVNLAPTEAAARAADPFLGTVVTRAQEGQSPLATTIAANRIDPEVWKLRIQAKKSEVAAAETQLRVAEDRWEDAQTRQKAGLVSQNEALVAESESAVARAKLDRERAELAEMELMLRHAESGIHISSSLLSRSEEAWPALVEGRRTDPEFNRYRILSKQSEVDGARAQLALAEAQLSRGTRLEERNMITGNELAKLKANHEIAQAKLRGLEADLAGLEREVSRYEPARATTVVEGQLTTVGSDMTAQLNRIEAKLDQLLERLGDVSPGGEVDTQPEGESGDPNRLK